MNIAILGGGGYIGSELTALLVHARNELLADYNVKVIDRFYFGKDKLSDLYKSPNLKLIQKDILDLTPTDFKDIDVVFDLAGISNDPACDLDEQLTFTINFNGCRNAALAAKDAGVKHYIYGSSCSVYGDTKNDIANENSILAPISLYARTKVYCEDFLLNLNNSYFAVTIVRNATVYGLSRRMRFDLLVNLMCLHGMKQNKIFVLGGGYQWRPLVNISDVVHIFEFLMQNRNSCANEIYNTCCDNVQPIDLAELIVNQIDCHDVKRDKVQIVTPPDDPDKRNYRVDSSKLTKLHYSKYPKSNTYKTHLNHGISLLIGRVGSMKDDLTTNTVGYYKHLIQTEKFIKDLSIDGHLFKGI